MGLGRREVRGELMDDPALQASEHLRALRALENLNRISRSAGHLWSAVKGVMAALGSPRGEAWRVLDVACARGELPVALALRARRAGVAVQVDGCDVSERVVEAARERSGQANADCRFFVLDAVRDAFPEGYDVITMSLFTHHLGDEEVISLLQRIVAAGARGVVVNDLHRSALSLVMAWGAAHGLTRSRVVHVDAVRSVRAAFTAREFGAMMASAGMAGARVRRAFPARFVATWVRR